MRAGGYIRREKRKEEIEEKRSRKRRKRVNLKTRLGTGGYMRKKKNGKRK